MDIGEKIREQRKAKGLTQGDLAKLLNKSPQVISNWERGYTPTIPHEDILNLATALDTTTDYLLGRIPAAIMKEAIPYDNFGKQIMLPIIGTVRCGHGMPVLENREGEEPVFEDDINGGQYFWLRVKGDSMYPEISPGCLALIRMQPEVENGEMALVVVNNEEGMIKQVYRSNGKIELRSINPNYKPRVFEGTDLKGVCIVGKVREVKKKY